MTFADHPDRRYRVRATLEGGLWAVRRRSGGVYLRAPITTKLTFDTEAERAAEALWWVSAWPDLPPNERDTLMLAARPKAGKRS
jgi:hypothetical protein